MCVGKVVTAKLAEHTHTQEGADLYCINILVSVSLSTLGYEPTNVSAEALRPVQFLYLVSRGMH